MGRVISVLWLLWLAGCLGTQEVKNLCDDPSRCPPCSADDECVISSNPCHETAYCHHLDEEVLVNQIGCNREYDVPSDEECRCIASRCLAE